VHLLDARNHGKSFHSEEFSYEIMSQDVIDYADDQGIEKFDLLGHSMGGKTAQFVAQQFPERVDRLIVVDIASKAYPPHHTEIL
jgi:pimeloyl-ACP methyl ester carboxylesterase